MLSKQFLEDLVQILVKEIARMNQAENVYQIGESSSTEEATKRIYESPDQPPKFWYVVFVGRQTGIYDNWEEAQAQVIGFPGNFHRKYRKWEDAEQAWNASLHR